MYYSNNFKKLVERRKQGGIDLKKRELQHYIDNNPRLKAKVELLEKLKKEKEEAEKSAKK